MYQYQIPGTYSLLFFVFSSYGDLCQWKRKVSIKSTRYEFQRYPTENFRYSFAIGTILQTENSELVETPKKTIPGAMLGQDRLEKNSGGCLARSGEIPSTRQTAIGKTKDCVRNSERSVLVRGSDPHYVGSPS